MLITYGQFQLQQAVRSSAHLLNPRTVLQSSMKMPRGSLIHYLDIQSDAQFPTRDLIYLAGIPENKRIPIFHLKDLTVKSEVQMLQDRYVDKKIRQWQRANMQAFRPWELLEVPNPDQLTNGVVNYNLLKSLYKYKTTLTSNLSRYSDLMSTYWNTVAEAIEKDPQSNHFASIAIPNAIPSRAIINRLVEFSPARYARVVTNLELNGLIQLYRYLNPAWRSGSTMAALSDSASEHLTIEFTYKGYSVFCKLSYLVSLLKESALESKVKLPVERLHQMFLLMLLKIQKNVEDKIQGNDPELLAEDALDAEPAQDGANQVTVLGDDVGDIEDGATVVADDVQDPQVAQFGQTLTKVTGSKAASFAPAPEINDESLFDVDTNAYTSLTKLLDSGLQEYEGASDDIFSKAVAKAAQTPEHLTDDTSEDLSEDSAAVDLHTVDYSEENIIRVLKDPTTQEKFEAYIQEAKGFDAISTAEARTLRKTFEKRQTLKSPYKDQQIDQYKQVTAEELSIPDTHIPITNDLVDDSLKEELLFNLDKKYTQGPMKKHLVACVTAFERSDIIVKDYQIEEVTSSIGKYEVHKLVLKPLRGKESSVYFRIPVINDEGEFVAGSIKYRMRRQKAD